MMSTRRIFAILASCALGFPARGASIAPYSQIASPPGGDVGCFVFDTLHPGVAFAGSSGGLIFRSTDGGAHWTPITVGAPDEEFRVIGQASGVASGLFYAFSTGAPPVTSNVIGSGRVYVSQNDGVTWTALAHQPPPVEGFYRGLGRGIALDPPARRWC